MRLPCLVSRFLYRQGWRQFDTYDELLTTPVARMFTGFIGITLMSNASHVNFGFPHDMIVTEELNVELQHEQRQRDQQFRANLEGVESNNQQDDWVSPQLAQAFEHSVHFHPRDGWHDVPLWYRVKGKWHRQFGVPAGMFPYVLAHAGDRVVSLNATNENPQPVKWIEYSPWHPNKKDDRSFVEVDLIVEFNGSLTIEFRGTRTEPYNVRVSRYAAGG